jgi:hypothetical protein
MPLRRLAQLPDGAARADDRVADQHGARVQARGRIDSGRPGVDAATGDGSLLARVGEYPPLAALAGQAELTYINFH